MNEPWRDFPDIWKSKSAYFSWLRGAFRRIWNKAPVKIKFLQKHRFKIENPSPKGKREIWGAKCNICTNTFSMKDIQVDHKVPAGSLQDFSDIEGFVTRLLACGDKDLQLVCCSCHTILTYSEKNKISFEEARSLKAIIDKTKQPIRKQKEQLLSLGFSEDEISNAEKRRECFVKVMETYEK